MADNTVVLLIVLGFLVLVGAMPFTAMYFSEKQRLAAIERAHQRTIETAKAMQWRSEQQAQGDGE